MSSGICFLIVFLVIADTVIRKRDIFSPFRLYLVFHSLAFGIALLGLHKAMTPFSLMTKVVYFGSGITFLIGTLFPVILEGTLSNRSADPRELETKRYNWRLHFMISGLVVCIYLVGIGLAILGTGGLPAFAKDVGKAIYDFMTYSFVSSLAISASAIGLSLLFMVAVSAKKGSKLKRRALALLLMVFIIHSLTFSRSALIFFVFFAMVYFHYAVRKIPIIRLAVIFTVVFSLFATVAYLKTKTLTAQYGLKEMSSAKMAKLVFIFPYLYFANNFWNLDYGLNGEDFQARYKPTYGFTTISGIYDAIYTGESIWGPDLRASYGFEDILHKQTQKVKGLNTVGYQWGLYKDFGVMGTLIIPFVFGWWIALLYRRVRTMPTIINIAIYSFVAYLIAFSWFLAFWESLVYVYSFMILIFITFVCEGAGPRKSNGPIQIAATE